MNDLGRNAWRVYMGTGYLTYIVGFNLLRNTIYSKIYVHSKKKGNKLSKYEFHII
jgi:hypothetical protein